MNSLSCYAKPCFWCTGLYYIHYCTVGHVVYCYPCAYTDFYMLITLYYMSMCYVQTSNLVCVVCSAWVMVWWVLYNSEVVLISD